MLANSCEDGGGTSARFRRQKVIYLCYSSFIASCFLHIFFCAHVDFQNDRISISASSSNPWASLLTRLRCTPCRSRFVSLVCKPLKCLTINHLVGFLGSNCRKYISSSYTEFMASSVIVFEIAICFFFTQPMRVSYFPLLCRFHCQNAY